MNVELILRDPLTVPSPLLVLPLPEGTETLEGALGKDGVALLEEKASSQMANFNAISKQLYKNFMALAHTD